MKKDNGFHVTKTPKVRIIDSIMGSGKSTYIIAEINKKPEQRYIYIGKYLDETQRIVDSCPQAHFMQPDEQKFGSKQGDFHALLREGNNIAITHELFKRLELSENERKIIQRFDYKLILDEVPEVIEPLNVSDMDKQEILERYVDVDTDGVVHWREKKYKGNHEGIKRQILSKAVIYFKDMLFLWLLPIDLLRAFSEVDVLTFLFEGSHLNGYMQIYKMPYTMHHIHHGMLMPGKQDLRKVMKGFMPLFDIYDGKLNNVGESKTALSSTWWRTEKSSAKVVEKNAYNYLYNMCSAKAHDAMWTRFKGRKKGSSMYLNGKHYSKSFLPCNACATNEHRHRRYLAYLINVFENPVILQWFEMHGVKLNEEEYALSQLVQWIWRSAIREGKKIHLYIPSIRMRQLLERFLMIEESVEEEWCTAS